MGAARYWVNLAWQARGNEQFLREVAAQQDEIEQHHDRLKTALGLVADHWSEDGAPDPHDLEFFHAFLSKESAFSCLPSIGIVTVDPPSTPVLAFETTAPIRPFIEKYGASIAQTPQLAEAAATARATSQVQFVSVDSAGVETGYFLVQPVFEAAGAQDPFLGWLIAPIDIRKFFDATNMLYRSELGITASSGLETLAYSSAPQDRSGTDPEPRFVASTEMQLFGRGWTLEFHSLPDLERLAENPVQRMQLLGTGIVSLAMAILAQVLSDRVTVVRRLVKERTRELSRRDREQRSILSNALVGIISLDRSGEILFQNRHSLDILNANNRTPAARNIRELIPDIDCELFTGDAPISFDEVIVAGRTLRIGGARWSANAKNDRITLIVLDISDQIEALLALEAVQQRLDAAMSSSEIGVFDVDIANNKSIVSDSWLKMMGLDGISPDFDAQAYFLACLHEEDRDIVASADRAVIEGRAKRSTAEYRITIPGRGERWMRSDAALFVNGSGPTPRRFVGTQVDITDEKTAQAALKASEDRFRQIFHNAPTGNLLADLDFQIIEYNQEMWKLLSRKLRLSDNTRMLSQIFGNKWPSLEPRLQDLADEKITRIRTEVGIERSEHFLAWLDVDASLFHDPVTNQPIYFFRIIDTTRLHAADRAKDEFLATVSHELRTPVTSIKGASGLLAMTAQDRLTPSEARLVNIIDRNADRVTELVSDILDIESLRTGEIEIHLAAESLDQILEETLENLQPFAEKFAATLVLQADQRGIQIIANHRRALQCLTNLVSNACKYGDHEFPVLIRTVAGTDPGICVEVINHGHGVPEPFESKLFTAFSRADTSDTRKSGGTGLGLKITKELMSRMGGDVTHHRDPEGRTVFTLRFRQAD